MFCRKCGTENEDQAVFCKECGARLVLGPSLESQIKKLVKRIASLPKKYRRTIKSIPFLLVPIKDSAA
jgi:uncharacterized membrane protein YvbJ